jgi:hypothetical protein
MIFPTSGESAYMRDDPWTVRFCESGFHTEHDVTVSAAAGLWEVGEFRRH